jgi:DNA-binding transcriptional LysR family regulator
MEESRPMLHAPRHFIYLDAVARAGSIRKAADKLHVASTALNRKILEIESDIGTPLFERLPRGVRLTAAGEVLLTAVRRTLADLRSAESQIEQLRGLVRGTVRVGGAESVSTDLLPATIAHYQQTHPGVQFQMKSGVTAQLLQALVADEVDMVLVHDPQPSEALRVITALPQPLCAMLRSADLQGHPVALGDTSFGSRRLIDAVTARARMSLKAVFEASNVQTLKDYTLLTGAVSFQYQIGTLREARRGELRSIPLSDPAFSQSKLVLATREGRMLPIASQAFLEVLVNRLAVLPD